MKIIMIYPKTLVLNIYYFVGYLYNRRKFFVMAASRIFKYMGENGEFIEGDITITIEKTDTLDSIKQKLKQQLPDVSNTQDIFFASIDDEKTPIDTIDALKNSTGNIVVTIAESLHGGRRRRSSTPRKSSTSRRRRSTKRRTASRKQQKRRRGSRRAH
jgi:hypothetical protein